MSRTGRVEVGCGTAASVGWNKPSGGSRLEPVAGLLHKGRMLWVPARLMEGESWCGPRKPTLRMGRMVEGEGRILGELIEDRSMLRVGLQHLRVDRGRLTAGQSRSTVGQGRLAAGWGELTSDQGRLRA